MKENYPCMDLGLGERESCSSGSFDLTPTLFWLSLLSNGLVVDECAKEQICQHFGS